MPWPRATRSAPPATFRWTASTLSFRSTRWSATFATWKRSRCGAGPKAPVYIQDVGYVQDSSDAPTGYALANGRRAVYILVTKRADASTMSVVNAVKAALPDMQAVLPPDIHVSYEFDQLPYVTRAIWGVVSEGALGAVLVGLMILLFLRDWRSAIIVLLNIPLALMAAVVALWLTRTDDQRDDPGRTCAGHRHSGGRGDRGDREHPHPDGPRPFDCQGRAAGKCADRRPAAVGDGLHPGRVHFVVLHAGRAAGDVRALVAGRRVLDGGLVSAVQHVRPRALRLAVASRAARTMAATLADPASAAVPTSIRLPDCHGLACVPAPSIASGKGTSGYWRGSSASAGVSWPPISPCLLAIIWGLGSRLGTEIFPTIDTGQFRLRIRAPDGTDIDQTEQIALKALAVIRDAAGADNVETSLGYLGTIGSSYPINGVFQWMRGPEEAIMWVALKRESGIHVEQFKEELRGQLAQALPGVHFSFEPADIINEVMSFGSPTPVEVAVNGPDFAETRPYAAKLMDEMGKLPGLRDLQIVQSLDYPMVQVDVDRKKAGTVYVTPNDVAKSLAEATSSSRFTVPNFWADPKTGIGYQVQVEVPRPVVRSPKGIKPIGSIDDLKMVPVKHNAAGQVLVRDVATVSTGTMPGEIDRYNMKRQVSMTANIAGTDLGSVSRQVAAALRRCRRAPARRQGRGPRADSADARHAQRAGHRARAGDCRHFPAAVGQFSVVAAVAGHRLHGPCGHCRGGGDALPDPHDVEHPVLHRRDHGRRRGDGQRDSAGHLCREPAPGTAGAGRGDAVRGGGRGRGSRLRPILMTTCAMMAGMLPMALALGESGQQNAPLGRAVIGGLAAATAATLFVLPSRLRLGAVARRTRVGVARSRRPRERLL